MFTIASTPFTGDASQDFAEKLKLILLTLQANSISMDRLQPQNSKHKTFTAAIRDIEDATYSEDDPEKLLLAKENLKKALFVKDFNAINAKAQLIILLNVEGAARCHITDIDYASDMIQRLQQVYATYNPIQHKIARDSFNSFDYAGQDPNDYYSSLNRLYQTANKCAPNERAKLTPLDLTYQFIVGLLGHTTLGAMANTWLVAFNANTLALSIPEMIQALLMNRLQEDIVTKRGNTLPPNLEQPPTRRPPAPRSRPCQFCQGDHWDKDCAKAPPCYKQRFHRPKDCKDCQERYAEKKEK
jgi:hypothetical protein